MISMSDTNIQQFIPTFANTGVPVAFLVPTPTGMEKSIMDATGPVRELLLNENVHDYASQLQGPANKAIVKTHLVSADGIKETETSLYRPVTKQGDPRIWIYNLKKYCSPCNLLALIVINKELYVFNLSDPQIAASIIGNGFCHSILEEYVGESEVIARELLAKLREIHNQGFLPSITKGDPGVGDTLENALGISRNNSKDPDYKGIELKTTRIAKDGKKKAKTRSTLFTRVPDEGMTYRQIVDSYGKIQIPKDHTQARLQLYETLRCSRPNAYDLIIEVDSNNGKLLLEHCDGSHRQYVSSWYFNSLRSALLQKHHETFWIKAQSKTENGLEYFRYDKVLHTKKPNVSLLAPLIESDTITIDLAAHYKPDGKWRDHGVLFKIMPDNLPLLLGESVEYDL